MYGLELTPEHPVETLSDFAVTAESVGFDAAFASHHYNNRDQFMALTDIARETETLQVGPGIANPYETHPVTLASRMATLEELSGGRGLFGIGPGDRSTLANLGYDQDGALRRTLETFKVAQKLWAGERVDHDGTFQAEDAALNYEVGSIPVYVGAQGPHMTRMAAKHADGVLFNGSHPRDYEWAAEQVAHGLDERPEHRGAFDFGAYASVSIAEDEDDAREAARPPVAFIAGSAAPPLLDRHDLDRERAEEISAAISSGDFETAFGAVTPAMIDAFCITGTPETVSEQIEAVLEYVDSFVAGSPLGPDVGTAIELLGDVFGRIDSA
ncbi:5,10-methylenetetrahydromethanopterin reductase [Halapricum hydrolyticum]|uniref:5,10-methylenetetrahydromethanopterin reductase n=1 Tax=Halapricum hydrolyticum TaxID=2979991 RepID=A0AAE3IBR6_9EURY|nr:5,10-methylenetetrahydromethanopterin reductase [Halapricum hydrolyticum]MCU4718236.1 5,10-methylenetetrahydromethanopterin reductase [Halapricum hydrolyticum]MCU4726323.1 5,10-methylenetetrahydromethanopterin reductase [Halapricum hydrolyticum]